MVRTSGWLLDRKCLVACLFFEESQQPTCPHVRHSRNCTQVSPILMHSSHACLFVVSILIWSRCVQRSALMQLISFRANSDPISQGWRPLHKHSGQIPELRRAAI